MTEKLFETALGISAPWSVAGADFDVQARTLTIRVDFAPGSRFAVPEVDGCQRGSKSAGFWGDAEIGHAPCLRVDCPVSFLQANFARSGTCRANARPTRSIDREGLAP